MSARTPVGRLAAWRQHRPRGHRAERPRQRLSRPDARRQARRGRRRRRHHRAPARGPAPHLGRRHRRADGGADPAAQLRDGRDRGDAAHRAAPPPPCRLHRARTARGADDRRRARGRAGRKPAGPFHRAARATRAAACRSSSPPTARRSRPPPGSARRSSNSTPAPIAISTPRAASRTATANSPACASMAAFAHSLGLEVHAGHGLTYDTVAAGRRASRGDGAQHRPFPDRRGDLPRPRPRDPRDAPPDGRDAGGLTAWPCSHGAGPAGVSPANPTRRRLASLVGAAPAVASPTELSGTPGRVAGPQ